ncbi:hypothetical protein Tco_0147714 [Tanacetum coccineum]
MANLSNYDGKAAQTTIPNTAAFQTKDLDAYDSDCDDVSNAKAVLMANVTPRQGGNTRRNVVDIITTQWCQQ